MNCSETVILLNLFILVPQTLFVASCIYMQINSLPAGGAVVVVESEVSTVTLYTKQSSAHKRCFIRPYMQDEMKMASIFFWKQFPSEIQRYKNTHMAFRFWNVQSSTKRSPQPPTFQITVCGIIFGISQIQENNFVVQTSHSL